MADQAVFDLLKALETLHQISDQDSADLEKSRGDAIRIQEQFETRVRDRLAGNTSPMELPKIDLAEQTARLNDKAARAFRREAAYLASFEALMRLYATEMHRETAHAIFGFLQRIRLIAVDESDSLTEASLPSFSDAANESDSEDRKLGMLRALSQHHETMKDMLSKRLSKWDRKIAESDALLEEALTTARGLIEQ